MSTISHPIPIFRVQNLETSLAYYTGTLGFKLNWYHGTNFGSDGLPGEPFGPWMDAEGKLWPMES